MSTKNVAIENEILKLRKEKKGYKSIARELGLGIAYVSEILIKNGMIDHIKLPSKEIVEKIISMYEDNFSMREIVKETGISRSCISSILKINHIEITKSGYHRGYENKIIHNYFECIDIEHKAYWLGFLYADGYNNENFYQIEITLKDEDAYMLELLKNDLKTIYNITDKEVKLNGKIFKNKRLTVYSKKMSEDLAKIGCCAKKSLVLTFPNYKSVPKHLIHHFMRGYFDGDGCISGNKFMVNGTKEFLEQYVEILRKETIISPAGSWHMDGQSHRWQHASKKDLEKIYSFLYKDESISLQRKKNKFINV